MKKLFICCIFGGLLSGCTTTVPGYENLAQSEGAFSIKDLRRPSEKEGKTFSALNRYSCTHGFHRFADSRTNPNRIEMLRHRVYEEYKRRSHLGVQMPGELKVKHFLVYFNTRYLALNNDYSVSVKSPKLNDYLTIPKGARGYVPNLYSVVSSVQCDPKEVALGVFTTDEVMTTSHAYVAIVDFEVDGIQARGRAVAMKPDTVIENAINAALRKVLPAI